MHAVTARILGTRQRRASAPSSSDTCSPSVVAVTVMAWPLAGAPRSRANGEEYPRLVRDLDRSVPARRARFAAAVFPVGDASGAAMARPYRP